MNKQNLRDKILNMHDYINTSFYVNHPNMDLGSRPANDVALLSIITGLVNGRQLTTGNYGLGKTTSAQAVSSLLYGLPIEFIEQGILQGHPMLTEEKIIGRLDYSKLTDEEKVIFSTFAHTPSAKIADELNRIPEGTQNMLLGAVETGNFRYLNEVIRHENLPFFATANYADGGNTSILPPLLDRFDISVEVGFPLFLSSYLRGDIDRNRFSDEQLTELDRLKEEHDEKILASIDSDNPADFKSLEADYISKVQEVSTAPSANQLRSLLSNPDLTSRLQGVILDSTTSHEDKMKLLNGVSKEYRTQIADEIRLSENERSGLLYLINNQKLSPGAELLISSLTDHLNNEVKINGEFKPDHNQNYTTGKVENNASVRTAIRSIPKYAKALSFIKGEDDVSLNSVQDILAYTLSHRLVFLDSYTAESSDESNASLQMQRTKQLVKEFIDDDFIPNRQKYERLYAAVKNGEAGTFLDANRDSDNPLIRALYKNQKWQTITTTKDYLDQIVQTERTK